MPRGSFLLFMVLPLLVAIGLGPDPRLVPDAAAETLTIREVEVLPVESLTRPEFQIDAVERALAAGRALPQGTQRVTVGDDGWLRDEALTGNYLVGTVTVAENGVWLLEAMGYAGVYVNGTLRIGNVYGYKDDWQAWEPQFNYATIPVPLHAGDNELVFFGVRWGGMRASLTRATTELSLNARDVTFPDLVVGQVARTVAALPVRNATPELVTDAQLEVRGPDGKRQRVAVPALPPYGVRKVGFPILLPAPSETGTVTFEVGVWRDGNILDQVAIPLEVKLPSDNRRITFTSRIDDSVQYYGFRSADDGTASAGHADTRPGLDRTQPKAFVLSLHGAGVEAINQSASYPSLSWAHLAAPTNRRPFGFDWENWGRLDALEVLDLNLERLDIAPDRVYLTGHSMGGHGTWHLATLHPDRFAAIGPSAGWITYWSYRREPPSDRPSPLKTMLARATLPSHTLDKAANLAPLGVYVLHGAADDNVSPEQSHLMVDRLRELHEDFVYHEQPDVGHWWDLSETPGADCVSWAPLFDFFARHRRPARDEVRHIRFLTPSPGVSAWNHWVGILRQERSFVMSRVDVTLDPWRHVVHGTTDNVALLGLDVSHLSTDTLRVELDAQSLSVAVPADGRVWLERRDAGTDTGTATDTWTATGAPDPVMKGPHRNGGFRNVFDHRVQLVVGTQGSAEETAWAWEKARYDAEYLWYQGNASLDVLPDTAFDPQAEPDRNVILYGNATTHEDWDALVSRTVRVANGRFDLDGQSLQADDLGVLAILPRPGSDMASVGIVSGTGMHGFRLTERRPCLKGGFAYPDLTVLQDRGDGSVVRGAGFFGNDWSVASGEFIWAEGF